MIRAVQSPLQKIHGKSGSLATKSSLIRRRPKDLERLSPQLTRRMCRGRTANKTLLSRWTNFGHSSRTKDGPKCRHVPHSRQELSLCEVEMWALPIHDYGRNSDCWSSSLLIFLVVYLVCLSALFLSCLSLIQAVMGERTGRVRFVLEDPINPSNAWACLRTLDSFGVQ